MSPLPCEVDGRQTATVALSCIVSGDVDLGLLLGDECRLAIPTDRPSVWHPACGQGLITRVVTDPPVLRRGELVTFHVTVSNALDRLRVIDVDPTHRPQFGVLTADGGYVKVPSPPGRDDLACNADETPWSQTEQRIVPQRVRLGLAPGATLHFDLVWRPAVSFDVHCKAVDVELPPGSYRALMVGPLLTGELIEAPLAVH
jgi:hypothetical protein